MVGRRTRALPSLAELIDLSGRRAMVTGAASGIGRAIAARLAEAGAALVLVDKDGALLHDAAAELESRGATLTSEVVDLGSKSNIDALWDGMNDRSPDILVNNAGIYPGRHLSDLSEDDYRLTMAVNLDAAVWMSQRLVIAREGSGAVIVNVGSVEAILPFKDDLAAYSVSKAGLIALTRAVAREHARHGVRANAVVPGGIVTEGTRKVAGEVLRGQVGLVKVGYDFMQRLPARRMGTPDEVARVVLFLCSDLAAYMHGAVVPVDGGFLAN